MSRTKDENEFSVIRVQIEKREDGGVRVRSCDLHGLILSGPDKQAVVDDIVPTITTLLTMRGFQGIHVHLSRSVSDVMNAADPQEVNALVREYVVEYAKAA